MSRVTIACCTTMLVVGCAKSDQPAKDTTTAAAISAPAPAPAPAPAFSLSDVAGKWQMRSVPESGSDTSATNYVLTATADTAGWFNTFPSGLKVPLHLALSGDSVLVKSGTYASQRRKGVKVTTESTLKIEGGKLVGTTIAHYAKAGPDSVLRLRNEGSKMP